ncbi:chaperone protein papD [Yersinia pseudotuberculosis]|uniref:fimbrial biogenesis chaperone n=1 Tax=Yersinia pseudotuberculosis TaxID=633 RepID=UPI0001739790|nr:molecular chaperone [Yersinia pseudotuberculosis]CQD56315.1 fimbrial chaperone protein [Yersinia intermedia]AJJ03724.1 chaperone protein papD [Yersinia pseudotuberculosis]AJJ67414.1 chaperone protein papD [Yersinia pseudotuberculosis PB1/+]AJJ71691.1 chaperone protein papD [Yersinia pseudotuberculosis]AYX16964.1 molecular chaperone [Yersinia pseudotuberculosis]
MKKLSLIALTSTVVFTSYTANAAIALDRTRIIYNGQDKSISLNISNENKTLPYLAQAWIENEQQQKVTTPLVATPPVQRVEAGKKSAVRISATPEALKLPQDRESLFYFNLREIPPRSEKSNVMQIALQTKIKLFYRPEGITPAPGQIWQEQLVLHKTAQGFRLENPTPYYITVVGLAEKGKSSADSNFQPLMVAPKSSAELKSASFTAPVLTYINDYGGRPELSFSCSGSICRAAKTI